MEHKNSNMMTPFDQLISNQNLQMLKLMIPYTPPETQRFLAVYVKFSEFRYTLDFFRNFKNELQTQDFEKKLFSPLDILQEIKPYLPEQMSETFDTLLNAVTAMELFETFRETSDSDEDTDSEFNPMSMMKNMLTPEQQGMFDMYNTMFQQNAETTETENSLNMKGNDEND